VQTRVVDALNGGTSHIEDVTSERLAGLVENGLVVASTDYEQVKHAHAVLIALPTPLSRQREPDLSYIERAAQSLAPVIQRGQVVVLESTTWPGTTREVMLPILEAGGLKAGEDFFLAFSPEREDPGNPDFSNSAIPKVVGADDEASRALATKVYDNLVTRTVPVTSSATAEAVKLTENIFRSVNIALVNELKIIFDQMGINVWEVIDAAKSKPFGYMAFYPGPGLGGHCIPIDPFYLTWKAKEFDTSTRFIELAGQINTAMPTYVITRLAEALDRRTGRGLNGAKILLMGMAYKKNVDDMRESPSLKLTHLLEDRGSTVDYHDPFIPEVPMTRDHPEFAGRKSIELSAENLAGYDVVLVATDHDDVDWAHVVEHSKLVVDTRNVCANIVSDKVVRA
jgi:UDP-N-acetyl-D-glucosamine dehydrogenase